MVHKASICTMSLGRCFAGHSMEHKLDMARKYGFEGIEVFYEDLLDLAGNDSAVTAQLSAARSLRHMCNSRGLEIICLQPFMHYGGEVNRELHKQRIEEFHIWTKLAHILGTDLVVLPSSFLPASQISEDLNLIVDDLKEVADIALRQSPPLRVAYEALSWGTRIDTWEGSWDMVQKVDSPNFGICFDSFNIAGRIYADPASYTGTTVDADDAVARSVERLLSVVDPEKIFVVQVADAERLSSPLVKGHDFYNAEQPCRMSWSRNCRLLYGEGYLPCREILDAIVNSLHYDGYLSFEVFNRRLADRDGTVPEEMASRGARSWKKMVEDLSLITSKSTTAEHDIQARL